MYTAKYAQKCPKQGFLQFSQKRFIRFFLIFCPILEANETFDLMHSLTHRKISLLSYGVPKMQKIAKISIFGAYIQFGSSDFFYFLHKSKSVCVKLINAKKLIVTVFALSHRGSKIGKNASLDFFDFLHNIRGI